VYTTTDAALFSETLISVRFKIKCDGAAVKENLYVKDGEGYSAVAVQTEGNQYQLSLAGAHWSFSSGTNYVEIFSDAGVEAGKPSLTLEYSNPGASSNPLPCSSETLIFGALAAVVYVAFDCNLPAFLSAK